MTKFLVIYYNKNDEEVSVEIDADDAASALGMVIDDYEDDFAEETPFVVDFPREDDEEHEADDDPPDDDGEPQVIVAKDDPGNTNVIQLFPKRRGTAKKTGVCL